MVTISPVATSAYLDTIPLFARTIPSTLPDADTVCVYLSSIGVTQLGFLYSNDVLGSSYFLDLTVSAQRHWLRIEPVSYDMELDKEMSSTLQTLHRSDLRFFFAAISSDNWEDVVIRLLQANLLNNPQYVWFFSETLTSVFSRDFDVNVETDALLILALNRSAVVSLKGG